MRWSSPSPRSYDDMHPPTKPWHWWFAWRPVKHCGQTFWLCWIPRRFVRQIIWLAPSYYAEYSWPEHSIAGNVLGDVKGRKHGPHRNK